MTCAEVRPLLIDHQRGRLAPAEERSVAAHVDLCPACAQASAEERVLTELLAWRLPRRPAPPALKRRLAALAATAARASVEGEPARAAPGLRRRRSSPVGLAAVAGIAAVAAIALLRHPAPPAADPLAVLASEAVSDHLRVLQRERRVDVESGGTHDVKPWFEGRVDFAPSVPAPPEPDVRLVGGTVGYFLDRPAAVVVYGLRKHLLTLLVFRADGLAWPEGKGGAHVPANADVRGFHVFLWRSGGLGYALVADVSPPELSAIAARLAAGT